MLLRDIRLRELNQSIVTCSGLASLETALKLFGQSNGNRIVIVDSQQHPLGLLKLERLLPYWLADLTVSDEKTPHQVDTSALLKIPIEAIASTVLEPLTTISDDWTVHQFLLQFEEQLQTPYALVNFQGEFLGLLDCDRLLQHLAKLVTTSPLPTQDEQVLRHVHTTSPTEQQQILTLTQQLVAQKAALEQQLKARQEQLKAQREEIEVLQKKTIALPVVQLLTSSGLENSFPSSFSRLSLLQTLLHLLERLPFPLMLQTNTGQIIFQNSVWQTQVGELSDPLKIWQEASDCLDTQSPHLELESQLGSHLDSVELTISSSSSESRYAHLHPSCDPKLPEDAVCRVGSTSDSCVCVCPLKDGQEQILQFVKISLGTLLPTLQLDLGNSAQPRESPKNFRSSLPHTKESSPQLHFQLATLTSTQQEAPSDQGASEENHYTDIESLWLVLAQDVTKQQDLAKELTAKNADLVHLNRLKDEFLACISHELKTPLTAVLGLSSLLKDQTLGELNQKQVHYAQLIYQSSRHLMGVVNDILDLTRIETGQFDLLFEPVNISTVCSGAFEQAKQSRLIESKTNPGLEENSLLAQFSLEIEPGLTTLVADELRLKQMLAHLLSNALKFTEARKLVGLKVNRWGGWIAFTVWDTGIGIPAEKQHLIFQKFQQLENPLTRQFEGAGLGLVLTHRLARLHGGDVTFISKEGQGSQFTILLPPSPPSKTQFNRGEWFEEEQENRRLAYANTAPSLTNRIPLEAVPRKVSALATGDRSRLILIVEAVPQFVETLTNHLTELGYRVIIARSGTEALEKARRIQPCIIFLDPFLPLLSGWDVLTLLKANIETHHIPVIITASGIDEEQAQKNQANGVLKVPIQSRELKRLLRHFHLEVKEKPAKPASTQLTILRLLPKEHPATSSPFVDQLNYLLQSHQHRVLESDDLEQADLLVKIWKPNAILLGVFNDEAHQYLRDLSAHPALAALPLITLDQKTTQAANTIPGLLVFPCLLSADALTKGNFLELSKLLQVLQVAVKSIWKSSVLAIDLSTLQMSAQTQGDTDKTSELGTFPKETKWLEAFMQYLQTAGLRGRIGRSWQDVIQQVESRNVDLLLLCWTGGEPRPEVLNMLSTFDHLTFKPPILVLDHRDPELGNETVIPLPSSIRKIATRILSPTVSMGELLEQIEQIMQSE